MNTRSDFNTVDNISTLLVLVMGLMPVVLVVLARVVLLKGAGGGACSDAASAVAKMAATVIPT
jgi:hypothetical protein